jgi:hypothetical protein
MGNFGRQGDTYAVIGNPVNIWFVLIR